MLLEGGEEINSANMTKLIAWAMWEVANGKNLAIY